MLGNLVSAEIGGVWGERLRIRKLKMGSHVESDLVEYIKLSNNGQTLLVISDELFH